MKVTRFQADVPPVKERYSCLKKYKTLSEAEEFVVYFSSRSRGMVLWAGKQAAHAQGVIRSDWDQAYFEPFHGRIVLEE